MGNPTSETIVGTTTVRGRVFTITRLTWAGTDDESFDVADEMTEAPLHDESFDEMPTTLDIEELLDNLADKVRTGELEDYLRGYFPELTEIVESVRQYRETFVPDAASAREAENIVAGIMWQTFGEMGAEASPGDYFADIVRDLIRSGRVALSIEEIREHMDAAHGGDGLAAVTFLWSTDKGRCYNCGIPAAFAVPDAYGTDATGELSAHHLRCAVCAANDAADGERVIRLDSIPTHHTTGERPYTFVSEGTADGTEYVTVLDAQGNPMEYNVPRERAVSEYGA